MIAADWFIINLIDLILYMPYIINPQLNLLAKQNGRTVMSYSSLINNTQYYHILKLKLTYMLDSPGNYEAEVVGVHIASSDSTEGIE
jgi:hypothetical protein